MDTIKIYYGGMTTDTFIASYSSSLETHKYFMIILTKPCKKKRVWLPSRLVLHKTVHQNALLRPKQIFFGI